MRPVPPVPLARSAPYPDAEPWKGVDRVIDTPTTAGRNQTGGRGYAPDLPDW